MNSEKTFERLIAYDEEPITQLEREAMDAALRDSQDLRQELSEIRWLKAAVKANDWAQRPKDPVGLMQSVMDRLEQPDPDAPPGPATKSQLNRHGKWIQSPYMGWVIASILFMFWMSKAGQFDEAQDRLQAALDAKNREQVLFQVAKLTYQEAKDRSQARLEWSELLQGSDHVDPVTLLQQLGPDHIKNAMDHVSTNHSPIHK